MLEVRVLEGSLWYRFGIELARTSVTPWASSLVLVASDNVGLAVAVVGRGVLTERAVSGLVVAEDLSAGLGLVGLGVGEGRGLWGNHFHLNRRRRRRGAADLFVLGDSGSGS